MKKGIKIASTGSTYIASGTPDSNFSSASSLLVGNLSSCCPAANEYRSIISFDLTNFSYPINMALLYLYIENIQSTTDCNLSISISNNTTAVIHFVRSKLFFTINLPLFYLPLNNYQFSKSA